MPEGNVIHNQARRLRNLFKGDCVVIDSPQGRFLEESKLVTDHVLTRVEAHGKHLFIGMDNGLWIHVHLGLFGKWRIAQGEAPEPIGQIRMRIRSDSGFAELRGPTTCEVLDSATKKQAVRKIGPDPIRKADPTPAWEKVHRSSTSIGSLLMDQRVFAGVGNIYRAEVLFRHNISPYRIGRDISRAEFDAIWADLVELMSKGTKRGRIDTVRPEHMPRAMGRPAREDRHGGEVYVYRRDGRHCYLCGAEIQMADMQGRKLYWCPKCQAA